MAAPYKNPVRGSKVLHSSTSIPNSLPDPVPNILDGVSDMLENNIQRLNEYASRFESLAIRLLGVTSENECTGAKCSIIPSNTIAKIDEKVSDFGTSLIRLGDVLARLETL